MDSACGAAHPSNPARVPRLMALPPDQEREISERLTMNGKGLLTIAIGTALVAILCGAAISADYAHR